MDFVLQAGVVSAPLQVLIERFASVAVREMSLILGADKEFRKLERTLERIRAMIGRVEDYRSFSSSSISGDAWKMWLEDVEVLSYSADDLLDGILLDLAKHKASLSADVDRDTKVRDMILSSVFKLSVPREVERIRVELEEIAGEMDALYKTDFTKLGPNKISMLGQAYSDYFCASSSLVNEGSVLGRDREKEEIVKMLLKTTSLSILPITGMGGIGNAQLIYNDARVVGEFEVMIWASVSIDFDTIRITKSIIESASRKRCKLSNLDSFQVKLLVTKHILKFNLRHLKSSLNVSPAT